MNNFMRLLMQLLKQNPGLFQGRGSGGVQTRSPFGPYSPRGPKGDQRLRQPPRAAFNVGGYPFAMPAQYGGPQPVSGPAGGGHGGPDTQDPDPQNRGGYMWSG